MFENLQFGLFPVFVFKEQHSCFNYICNVRGLHFSMALAGKLCNFFGIPNKLLGCLQSSWSEI